METKTRHVVISVCFSSKGGSRMFGEPPTHVLFYKKNEKKRQFDLLGFGKSSCFLMFLFVWKTWNVQKWGVTSGLRVHQSRLLSVRKRKKVSFSKKDQTCTKHEPSVYQCVLSWFVVDFCDLCEIIMISQLFFRNTHFVTFAWKPLAQRQNRLPEIYMTICVLRRLLPFCELVENDLNSCFCWICLVNILECVVVVWKTQTLGYIWHWTLRGALNCPGYIWTLQGT